MSHVSIVPSRVEAFGLVAVEALACGTPVIASNQGGLPEIINDEVGMIFTVDNEKEKRFELGSLKAGEEVEQEILVKTNLRPENIAEYALPREVVFRETLPKTAMGKVNFKALMEEKRVK